MSLSTTVSALTRDRFMPILVDNIFNSNVLCFKLLKNADLLDGGAKIITPVEYVNSGNNGWLESGGVISAGDDAGQSSRSTKQDIVEIARKAEWDWATGYQSIVLSGEEQYVNSGGSQVLSVLKAHMSNAEKSLKDMFGVGMFSDSVINHGITSINGSGTEVDSGTAGANALNIDGADDQWESPAGGAGICGTARSLGGFSSSGKTWWDAKVGTFASFSSAPESPATFAECVKTGEGVANIVQKMTRMYGACTIDNDQPNLIVTTQVLYDAYESSLQGNKRFDGDASLADAGFQSLRFKGASVTVDSHCDDGHMYFLNTKYLDFKVHSKRNFALEDFKQLEGKDALQARIFWMGQLVCTAPRMMGLLVGGPSSY